MTSRQLGAACVIGAATLWGFWPLWVRGGGGDSAQVATMAFLVSGVLGAPLGLYEGRGRHRSVRAWLLLGLLGLLDGANAWCYFRALAEGAVAPAVLSHYLAPVLVALMAPLLLGEPRSRRTPIALALALAGTAALVFSGDRSPSGSGAERALLFGSISAAFYAANILVSKKLAPSFGNAELMSYHALIAVAVLLPMTGLSGSPRALALPIFGGLVSTLGAGILYYVGLRRIPAERAGILAYLEPVVAVLVGWIAFGETPSALAAVGGALVVGSGVLVISGD